MDLVYLFLGVLVLLLGVFIFRIGRRPPSDGGW